MLAMSAPRPHILFALADDFGWANAGWHRSAGQGLAEAQTPNLDALATGGIQLDRYYAYHICSPSRSALQSGRLPVHVNTANAAMSSHNPKDPVSGFAGIPRNMTCVANKLGEVGYSTHFVGKWCACRSSQHLPWCDCHSCLRPQGRRHGDAAAHADGARVRLVVRLLPALERLLDEGHGQGHHGARDDGRDRLVPQPLRRLLRGERDIRRRRARRGRSVRRVQDVDGRRPRVLRGPPLQGAHAAHHRRARRGHAALPRPRLPHRALAAASAARVRPSLSNPLPRQSLPSVPPIPSLPLAAFPRADAFPVRHSYLAKAAAAAAPFTFDDSNRQYYSAMVLYMDDAVGEFVAALKKKQMWETTLFAFAADNGGPYNIFQNSPPCGSSHHPLVGPIYEPGAANNHPLKVATAPSPEACPPILRPTRAPAGRQVLRLGRFSDWENSNVGRVAPAPA